MGVYPCSVAGMVFTSFKSVFFLWSALVLGRVDGNSSYNSMGDNWGSHRFAQVKLEFLNTYIFSPSKADISPKQ